MNMPKTKNGRPAGLGSFYVDNNDYRMKFCVGYCPQCKTKIGLTTDEIKEFVDRTPSRIALFFYRFFRMRRPK